MARVRQKVNYYNFSGGKMSDNNPITPPENVVRTLLNVDVRRNGTVVRRLGLEPEGNFSFPYNPELRDEGDTEGSFYPGYSLAQLKELSVDMYSWTDVDFSPDLNFIVVRIGNQLLIYRPTSTNLSGSLIKVIDISGFLTAEEDLDISNSFQAVSGKGLLVCSGSSYKPFYIKYDSLNNTWTVEEIQIRIRDFEGVDDGLRVDERVDGTSGPSALTDLHRYNLLNQGWASWEIVDFAYETGRYGGHTWYPANSDIAALGRVIEGSSAGFIANRIVNVPTSTGTPPKGHYIIDPFNTYSRADVAGPDTGLTRPFSVGGVITTKRPKAVAFYQGRFFYGSVNGVIYYSKIIESVEDLGKCYQENDPTSEDSNQVIDTDGGTLKVLNIGTVEAMVPMGNSMVIMGTSGIYVLSGGSDKGFTANNQQLGFLSRVPTTGYKSVVTTNGPVVFWSDRGIFGIGSNEIGDPQIQSLSDNKIALDYDRIPLAAKLTAHGCFEPVENRVYWCYNQNMVTVEDEVRFKYTNVLVLDLNTGAFWDYELTDVGFTDLETTPYPMMVGTISSPARLVNVVDEAVTVDDEDVVIDDDIVVTVRRLQYGDFNTQYAAGVFIPDENGDYYFTFAKWTARTFLDWGRLTTEDQEYNANSEYTDWPVINHVAGNYASIVETLPATLGEPSVKKQSPYVYTYYQAAREGYPSYDLTDPGVDPEPIPPDVRLSSDWWEPEDFGFGVGNDRLVAWNAGTQRWDFLLPAYDSDWPLITPSGILGLLPVTPEMDYWTQGLPLYRPLYMTITFNSGPPSPGDYTQATFYLADGLGNGLNGPSPEDVGWTAWNQDRQLTLPLTFFGTGEVIHAITEMRLNIGNSTWSGTEWIGDGAYEPYISEITFHHEPAP